MSFNINQVKEGYGSANLEWGKYPWMSDPHRCGTSAFSPQIMPDGSQNSCGSYCSGFDKNGCNKYLPNYPDDYYILNYVASGGNCDDLKDCKREITPIPHPDRNCDSTQFGYSSHAKAGSSAGMGGDYTNKVGPGIDYPVIENFGMFPETASGVVMWLLFLYLIAYIIFVKK